MRTAYSLPGVLASWFSIVEVPDAEPMAGELFRRSFNDYPPDVPHHYVARVSLDGEQRTIGYVHMRPLEDMFLCGGMCMDDRVFRHLPHERRAALKAVGGVAEQLLRHAFADLAHARAIFGYVGDKRAERVDLRAGFEHTGVEHLIVYWPRWLPELEKTALVERVARAGPF
ncbi:MAG: hypothetical protein ACYC9Z_05870 [Casimicrobiaceae bacterium]